MLKKRLQNEGHKSEVKNEVKNEGYKNPKFDVHMKVFFQDPHSERRAFGEVVSEWDR
jgi:ribosomal protein S20